MFPQIILVSGVAALFLLLSFLVWVSLFRLFEDLILSDKSELWATLILVAFWIIVIAISYSL